MRKSSKQLVDEAMAQIETLSVDEARARLGESDTQFVDLREKGELYREGKVPGAVSVPRGLLEFWIDPESPYFNEALSDTKKLVLFCAAGWRSALATKTLKDMGYDNVSHIDGGFAAWRDGGGEIEMPEPRR